MIYTGCPRRNVSDFGRVFLMLKYTDINQNTYVQSWTVTELMAREKCGLLAGPRTVPVSWQSYPYPSLSVVSYDGNSPHASHWTVQVLPSGWYTVQVPAALWIVGVYIYIYIYIFIYLIQKLFSIGTVSISIFFRNIPHSNHCPEVTSLHEGAGFLYSMR